LAYQPPAISTFLSEQTSHQQPASSTFLSEQISTSHQPPANEQAVVLPNVFPKLIQSSNRISSTSIVTAGVATTTGTTMILLSSKIIS
jgi:hypothetical protein